MNSRDRFLKTMYFEKPDRPLLWEFGYWPQTLRRWYKEGLPGRMELLNVNSTIAGEVQPWPRNGNLRDRDVHDFCGFDVGLRRVEIQEWIYPPFENKVLEEDEKTQIIINNWGIKQKIFKSDTGVPQFLDWPVKTHDDFSELKKSHLNPETEGRFPLNWESIARAYEYRSYPLSIGGYPIGLFGALRHLMGERLYYAFYDQPSLIKEILDHLTNLWLYLWEKVSSKVEVDCVVFWEDMSYNKGSLISPSMFKKFLSPFYKRIIDFLRRKGIDIAIVDTDGDCWELIPLFMETGITGLYPFEVQAGMDITEVRKAYPALQIIGGLNKIVLNSNRVKIREELKKVKKIHKKFGYIACADHNIPPDVSFEEFIYYRQELKNILYQ